MSRTFILALLCITAVSLPTIAATDKNTNLADLGGTRYTVDLSYGNAFTGGYTTPAPCLDFNPTNSTCLPQVNILNGDCIRIDYSLNTSAPGAVLNATSTVMLRGCFSPYSSMNRGWRKAVPLIYKDINSQCQTEIAEDLPAGNGSYTWCPNANVASSTMRVRLYEKCSTEDGDFQYCAWGQSKGFFQIIQDTSLPSWMLACIGVFAAIGPVSLGLFFIWEFKVKRA